MITLPLIQGPSLFQSYHIIVPSKGGELGVDKVNVYHQAREHARAPGLAPEGVISAKGRHEGYAFLTVLAGLAGPDLPKIMHSSRRNPKYHSSLFIPESTQDPSSRKLHRFFGGPGILSKLQVNYGR